MEAMTFRYECPNCHRVEFAGRMAEGSLYCPNADCAEIGWAMKCTVLLPPQSKTPRPFQTEVERRVADLERKVRDLESYANAPSMSPEAYARAVAEEEGAPRQGGAKRIEVTDAPPLMIHIINEHLLDVARKFSGDASEFKAELLRVRSEYDALRANIKRIKPALLCVLNALEGE